MNDFFHASLETYKAETVCYGRFAQEMLRSSLAAFAAGDTVVAEDIIRRKEYVSNEYGHLKERGLLLIALNQPVAADLRLISCCLDVVASSERIGRYGKDIAEVTRKGTKTMPADLTEMGRLTLAFLDLMYNAFESGDLSLLSQGAEFERRIDVLYAGVSNDVIRDMEEGKIAIAFGSFCLLVSRYLERCGDHACRMGERIFYLHTGKRVTFEKIGR